MAIKTYISAEDYHPLHRVLLCERTKLEGSLALLPHTIRAELTNDPKKIVAYVNAYVIKIFRTTPAEKHKDLYWHIWDLADRPKVSKGKKVEEWGAEHVEESPVRLIAALKRLDCFPKTEIRVYAARKEHNCWQARLTPDLYRYVMNFLEPSDVAHAETSCLSWKNLTLPTVWSNQCRIQRIKGDNKTAFTNLQHPAAFGKEQFEAHYPIILPPQPSLPWKLFKEYEDGDLLRLIPRGHSPELMDKLADKPKRGNKTGFRWVGSSERLMSIRVDRSYWVLLKQIAKSSVVRLTSREGAATMDEITNACFTTFTSSGERILADRRVITFEAEYDGMRFWHYMMRFPQEGLVSEGIFGFGDPFQCSFVRARRVTPQAPGYLEEPPKEQPPAEPSGILSWFKEGFLTLG